MSDNITQITELNIDKEPEHRFTVKKIVIFAVVIVAICSMISLFLFSDSLNLDTVRRWGKYLFDSSDEEYGRYSFDAHSSNCYANYGDGIVIASIGGLATYDKNGDEGHILQHQMELPQLLVSGDMAAAYDVGGHALIALHRKQGEILKVEQTHPILDADLADNGAICISSSASGYKSVLSVYNDEQDLVYRWLSSSTYFPVCAVSPDGHEMSAVAVGQTEGVFESSIYVFKTDSEEVQNKISIGNDLIYDLFYLDDHSLCVVGETMVQIVSVKGQVLNTYQYGDPYLKDFDRGGDGFLTVVTNKYRAGNRYSLTTVNEKGREIATRYIGAEVLDISACGRYIAVLTPGKLTVYTPSLGVYCEMTDVSNVTSVMMRADGTVLLIGGGQGKLYIP